MNYEQIIIDSIEFAKQNGFTGQADRYIGQPIIKLIFDCEWASKFFGIQDTEWRELFSLDKKEAWGNRMFLADDNTLIKITVPLWVYHQHRLLDAWQHGAVDDIFASLVERMKAAEEDKKLDNVEPKS